MSPRRRQGTPAGPRALAPAVTPGLAGWFPGRQCPRSPLPACRSPTAASYRRLPARRAAKPAAGAWELAESAWDARQVEELLAKLRDLQR